jgi:hypothetical protein
MVLVEFRLKHNCPSEEETANTIERLGIFPQHSTKLKSIINAMMKAGSKYRSIEKALEQPGICLVLGKGMPENT